jgi:hypothetical protein
MIEPLETLRLRLKDEIKAASDYLAAGNVKDMTEYARITGKVAALRAVLEEILEIERRYAED